MLASILEGGSAGGGPSVLKLLINIYARCAKQNGKAPSSQLGLLIDGIEGRRENDIVGSTSNPLQVQFRNRAWLKLVIPRRR